MPRAPKYSRRGSAEEGTRLDFRGGWKSEVMPYVPKGSGAGSRSMEASTSAAGMAGRGFSTTDISRSSGWTGSRSAAVGSANSGASFATRWDQRVGLANRSGSGGVSASIGYAHASAAPSAGHMARSVHLEEEEEGRQACASDSICALIESRAREVGLAVLHRRSMEFELTQFSDTGNYCRTVAAVLALEPAAVVVSRTARNTELLKVLQDALQRSDLPEPYFAERRFFDETEGQVLLEEADVNGLQPSEFPSKFVACAAFTALWHFAQSSLELRLQASVVRVIYRAATDTMLIDSNTARLLELVKGIKGHRASKPMTSLFKCLTPGGARLLRQSLLQPPAAKAEILARQAAVDAVLGDEVLFRRLQEFLPAVGDVDLLAARLTAEPKTRGMQWCKAAIRTAMRLRQALAVLPHLAESLAGSQAQEASLLAEAGVALSESRLQRMLEELNRVLDSDGLPTQSGRGSLAHAALLYSVRPNVSALLDVARQMWNDAMEQVHTLHRGYAVNYPEMNIRLEFTERRGWYLSHARQDMPPEFIRTTPKGASGRHMSTTRDFNCVNFKLRQAEREVLTQTVSVLDGLYDLLRSEAALLYRVSHAANILDLIQAFVRYSFVSGRSARPEFTDDPATPIAIKAGRHPLREQLLASSGQAEGFEPLDYFIGEDCHFQAVTGPNGGGKSTYLQTLAQLVVLAHIGCHIPAETAVIRIVSSLFTRIGSTDNLEASASTFLVEMQEAAHILSTATADSLVLIDELGRGTAHVEGIALCLAICEKLLELQVFTLFATHFFEVCRLQTVSSGFRNIHIAPAGDADVGHGQATRKRYVVSHLSSLDDLLQKPKTRYGIDLASKAGLPETLVGRARQFAEEVDSRLTKQLARNLDAATGRASEDMEVPWQERLGEMGGERNGSR